MRGTLQASLCLLLVIVGGSTCYGWAWPPRLDVTTHRQNQRQEKAHHNAIILTNSAACSGQEQHATHMSRAFVNGIAATFVAAALLLGGPTDQAWASDEMLLFDLSKDDSVMIEARAPPEIKSASSDRALALSQRLKENNARMYGAYWCSHCAAQKEAFGTDAFNNIEYVECSEVGENSKATTLCAENNIQGYPTWQIKGKLFSGERTLDEIETLVRMAEASPPGRNSKAPPRIMTTSSDRALAISNQLAALNARLYGAYWCANTFEQKEFLGREALNNIEYVECAKEGDNSKLNICKEQAVQVVPTWQIDGEMYPGVQEFADLEEIIADKGKGTLRSSTPATTAQVAVDVDKTPTATTSQPSQPEKIVLPALPPARTATKSEDPSNRALALASRLQKLPETRLYGASWCSFTKHQKDLFGKEAANKIPYVECDSASQKELCRKKGVKVFPQWEILGNVFAAGELSLDQLETLVQNAEMAMSAPKTIEKAAAPTPPSIKSTSSEQNAEKPTPPPKKLEGPAAATTPPSIISTSSEQNGEKTTPAPQKIKEPTAEPLPPAIKSTSSKQALALASQLETLNTKFYGAYWCGHCVDQKEVLGKEGFAKLQYVECARDGQNSQPALCKEKGISSVPTWEIAGKIHTGEHTLEELEEFVQTELSLSAKAGASVVVVAAKEAPSPVEAQDAKPKDAAKPKDGEGRSAPAITTASSERALKLASQLETLDTKLYGGYWCGYTKMQKERLGKEAIAKIQYVECSKDGKNSATETCISKKIEGYPTWEVNGKLYPGDQELDELEAIVKENQ